MEKEKVRKPKNSKPEKEEKMPLLYGGFDSASEIVFNDLIPNYHPHLANAKFLFLCRNTAAKSSGQKVPGSVKKASPLERYAGSFLNSGEEPDFIMIIALEVWNEYPPNKRKALLDHLLMRCVAEENPVTGNVSYGTRPPNVQEFPEIVTRHGSWNESVEEMIHACK